MKQGCSISIFLIISLLLLSSCSMNQLLKKADKKYEIGEYNTAAIIYKRLLPRVPSKNKYLRGEISLKMGHCYLLTNQNLRAEAALRNALRFGTDDSMAFIYYAEVLRRTEKYSEARANYAKYLDFDSESSWAKNGLYASENAKKWKSIKNPYSIKKEDVLNSRKSDYSPVIADDDGSTLYFTSSRDNTATGAKISKITGLRNNDIFVIKKNNAGKWETAQALPADINTEYDEGACCFSSDGKTMYYTQCRYLPGFTMGAEIYCSQRAGGEWTTPKRIMLINDSTRSVAHPSISPDDRYLYFVSDMRGGFGGKDLWRCQKISDAEWGPPENLGSDINTSGDEMFPTFKSDGTLFFSSNGLPGFGGLDIFKANLIEENSKADTLAWTVKNLLSPINSSEDDFGMTFVGKGNKGYFSSNRKDPKGYDKIYSFDVPIIEYSVEGKVLENNNEPVSDAYVRIIGDNGTNTKIKVKKDGSYKLKLEKGVNYALQASARGFVNDKNTLSTFDLNKTKYTNIDFKLASIGKAINIENIFYEFGKYTLTKSSEDALKGLVKMLNDNPNITIEISAHTDLVGSEESNLILSTKRAESVVQFLVSSGIESERLTAKGYGKSKPVQIDENLAKLHPEIFKEGDILTEEFILKLPIKQQEICNKINRRTEFTVLKTTYKMF